MTKVSWKQSADPIQGRASGDLCLRVVGTAHRGKVARLSAAKCTIGSADGCSLRLRAAGVRPLHCVILRGTNGTVVRSWSPDTRLNGQPFGDALLASGDRLGIGPIELEVVPAEGRVDVELEQQQQQGCEPCEREDQANSDFQQRRAQLQTQFDGRLSQLDEEQQRWNSRQQSEEARLADAWSQLEQQRSAFEAEKQACNDRPRQESHKGSKPANKRNKPWKR